MNGFVIPVLNVSSSIVSDTDMFFIFFFLYVIGGKMKQRPWSQISTVNLSIYLRKTDKLMWRLPISRVKQIAEEKLFFSSDIFRYQERALNWNFRGSSVKPAS